jgi:non-lysosomal glucosylceramidase
VLRSDMGSEDTENPQYQVGEGCLVDQLVGQYLADVAGLGPLVSRQHARTALESIYRYNYKRTMFEHDNVQRTFVLNDEAAMVVCDYGKAQRPRIPFPYYAEVFTGLEYTTASQMLHAGMIREGIECIGSIRARYDGEKRNPWDEAECGHHYARAMAAWSAFVALSGFRYNGATAAVTAAPQISGHRFECFWSTATGWGEFAVGRGDGGYRLILQVHAGRLLCRTCEVAFINGTKSSAQVNRKAVSHTLEDRGSHVVARFAELLTLKENDELMFEL